MDRVFSMDNLADHFWSSPPPLPSIHDIMTLNRSSSEFALQLLLQEAVHASNATPSLADHDKCIGGEKSDLGPHIPVDSDEYQAFLRNKLDLACRAVSFTRANCVIPRESSGAAPDIISQLPSSVQIGNHHALTDKDVVGSTVPLLPAVQKKLCVQVTSTTSLLSSDQSGDDEADCGTIETLDPTDAKRVRRMLSNRESARRSRRRKKTHLTELETQASQLRAENSSLLKQLTDVSTKYNEAAVDNRVLKADVETLRAKVKMAEETLKRITGSDQFLQAVPEMSKVMPSYAGRTCNTSTDADMHVQDDPKQQYYATPCNSHLASHDMRIQNVLADIPLEDNVGDGSRRYESIEMDPEDFLRYYDIDI